MINDAVPGTIDLKDIKTMKPLNNIEVKDNLMRGLKSGISIGCEIDEITPLDIVKGKGKDILKVLSEVFWVNFHFY